MSSKSNESRVTQRWSRLTGLFRRAVGHAGPDRDALLLIVKSVVAATLAWVLADVVLQAPSSTFAPFSALLMVQVTVSRSLDQSSRYALAVVSGVVLTGLLSPVLGPTVWTFAVLMLIALIIGRWRRLGSQGPQVAVAALFAYAAVAQSGSSQSSVTQLFSMAGLVMLGCLLGVITNLLIFPPLRYRSAEYAVGALSQSMCDLLSDLARGLREGVPDSDAAESWHYRANQLPDSVSQARSSVEHAAETLRFNPRRLFMKQGGSFEGYRAIINALERATEQLRAITRGLTYAANADNPTEAHERFLRSYADLLDVVASAARVLGELHNNEDLREENELNDKVQQGRDGYQDLAGQAEGQELDPADSWPTYGALQTDAHRLVEEFVQSQRELARLVSSAAD